MMNLLIICKAFNQCELVQCKGQSGSGSAEEMHFKSLNVSEKKKAGEESQYANA